MEGEVTQMLSAEHTCETCPSHVVVLFHLPLSCVPYLPLHYVSEWDSESTVKIPRAVFNHMLDKSLAKHVRPPTKKHRGKKLRQSKPILTTAGIWQEQLSASKGLPTEVILRVCVPRG